MTFSAIFVLLLSPRAEAAGAAAIIFTVGAIVDLALVAILMFAILPWLQIDSFCALALTLAVFLVPLGALFALASKPWQVALMTAMATVFLPLFPASQRDGL